jgi:hypothetical protein
MKSYCTVRKQLLHGHIHVHVLYCKQLLHGDVLYCTSILLLYSKPSRLIGPIYKEWASQRLLIQIGRRKRTTNTIRLTFYSTPTTVTQVIPERD